MFRFRPSRRQNRPGQTRRDGAISGLAEGGRGKAMPWQPRVVGLGGTRRRPEVRHIAHGIAGNGSIVSGSGAACGGSSNDCRQDHGLVNWPGLTLGLLRSCNRLDPDPDSLTKGFHCAGKLRPSRIVVIA